MAYFRSFPQLGATGIAISPTTATVPIKGVLVFDVTVTPSGSSDEGNYTVTSSNTSILTVTKSGMKVYAYGIALGSATITVSLNGHTATANTTVDYVGSYFVFNNNKYYYDFVLVDKTASTTGIATVIQRYTYSGFTGQWGGSYSNFDDSNASFRTTINSYINANFSTQLKNNLQSSTKHAVKGSGSTFSEYSLSDRFFLPSEYETWDGITIKPNTDSRITYFNRNNRFGEIISGDTVTQQLSRSVSSDNDITKRKPLVFTKTYPNYAFVEFTSTIPLRPYFFLSNALHVRDEANSDGSYSIDWTGQSSKTIYNLNTGTIIRDDSGTGRTG